MTKKTKSGAENESLFSLFSQLLDTLSCHISFFSVMAFLAQWIPKTIQSIGVEESPVTLWFHECRNVFIRWWLGKTWMQKCDYMPSLQSSISTSDYSFLLSHWPEGHRPGIRPAMPKDVYSEMQIIWHVFKRGKRKVTQNWGFSLIFINY